MFCGFLVDVDVYCCFLESRVTDGDGVGVVGLGGF